MHTTLPDCPLGCLHHLPHMHRDSVAGFPGNNVTSMCPNPSNYMYANVEHLSSHAQMLLAEAIQGHLAAQSPELFA